MFTLNRVQFNKIEQKLVKDNSRFEFDQIIYSDLFLSINQEKAEEHMKNLDSMKLELNNLKNNYDQYYSDSQDKNHAQDILQVFSAC